MKKIFYISVLFICSFITNGYALSADGNKKINICRTVNDCLDIEENIVYKILYNDMYNISFEKEMSLLGFYGVDSAYFVDDVDKYAKCFADAFAMEITVEEANIINSGYASTPTRDAIFNNINNKHMNRCKKKYIPYKDDAQSILSTYISKKCNLSEQKDYFEKCVDNLTADFIKKRDNRDRVCGHIRNKDDFEKCFNKYKSGNLK